MVPLSRTTVCSERSAQPAERRDMTQPLHARSKPSTRRRVFSLHEDELLRNNARIVKQRKTAVGASKNHCCRCFNLFTMDATPHITKIRTRPCLSAQKNLLPCIGLVSQARPAGLITLQNRVPGHPLVPILLQTAHGNLNTSCPAAGRTNVMLPQHQNTRLRSKSRSLRPTKPGML